MRLQSIGGVLGMVLTFAPALPVSADASTDQARQRYEQGLAYERLGRITDAYTELQLASTLDPQNAKTATALGIVAVRMARYEAAQRALEQSITLDANSVASYYHLALIYENLGQKDRALDAWHRFAGLSQDLPLKQIAEKHVRYLELP